MLLQTAQPYNKRNRERNKDESFKGVDLFNARPCLYRESCVIKIKASLLACNIFISFSSVAANNGYIDKNWFVLLTVARQPVICTRFLFNFPPQRKNLYLIDSYAKNWRRS